MLQIFPADRVVGVFYKSPVAQNVGEDLEKALLPGIVCGLFPQPLFCLIDIDPFDQIIDILEMVVKGLTVHAAVF